MSAEKKGNMYSDSIFQWNVCVGCNFFCEYCKKSFQAQMKRQMPKFDENGVQYRGCQKCYDYEPHFHEERLDINFNKKKYETSGDTFIWAISSGDIACMNPEWIQQIINKIKEYPHRTFFMQTKDPSCFYQYTFPENMLLGITLETDQYHSKITNAPNPFFRYITFADLPFPRKVVTIEPIMDFDFYRFLAWIRIIGPERVYIGYDTKKCNLREPSLRKTLRFISELKKYTKVKTKFLKKYHHQSGITQQWSKHKSLGEEATASPDD